ncbi:ATP-binding cassette transporter [Mycena kentingensis (nom. inval.)]|nr:ATP-binding cassette transporter [Mycena kentingensis (nom. inval.)]
MTTLELQILVYGSCSRDPEDDSRYGADQRRAEILLQPVIPIEANTIAKKQEWVDKFAPILQSIGERDAEERARETVWNKASWLHLNPPRMTCYVHNICDMDNPVCGEYIRQGDVEMARLNGLPRPPPLTRKRPEPGWDFPLSASCAECHEESVKSRKKLKQCGRCGLTRYCSVECQRTDWPRHKVCCKAVKEVKWLVEIANSDAFALSRRILADNPQGKVAVQNLASDITPGGPWLDLLTTTQEEALCYSSTLYVTLKEEYYPWPNLGPGCVAGVFSPGVVVFRDDLDHDCTELALDARTVVSVITVAAPARPELTADKTAFAKAETLAYLQEKIRLVYRMAAHNQQDYLILGAMGCGAYGRPNRVVATQMRDILLESEFRGRFKRVLFAVYSRPGSEQLVLSSISSMASSTSWNGDTLVLPVYVAVASLAILLVQLAWSSKPGTRIRTVFFKDFVQQNAAPEAHFGATLALHFEKHGGREIFFFKLARFVGCLVLLALSAAAVILDDTSTQPQPLSAASWRTRLSSASFRNWEQEPSQYPLFTQAVDSDQRLHMAICAVYLYTTFCSIATLSARMHASQIAARHVNTVLLCALIVYTYRDVFPLATYTLSPLDAWEGHLLWPKLFVLIFTSVAIPLAMPRQYVPLDPKNPSPEPGPEQTASILSSALYLFLSPIVFLAYRIPHLSFDQLPPICDYDAMMALKVRAFPHVDAFMSKKRRHVAFGFLWVFRWEFLTMAALLVVSGLASFVSPLAINRILDYLENPDTERVMKPWFWILLLFAGPATYTLAFQWDMFVGTHIMAQTSSIVNQLVFEHALRIRVKSETGKKDKQMDGDDKDNAESKPDANLMGRINTLLTVDLMNIIEARNFLFIVVLVPIQVGGSIVFLYHVLGWSAFVAAGSMLLLAPIPGYATKLLASIQEKTLAKTDARVQTVTETLGVLRMIKMFGWEKQLKERIDEKREVELIWIWWRKIIFTFQAVVNYVVPAATMLVTYVSLQLIYPITDPDKPAYVSACIYRVFANAPQTVLMKQELSASKVFSSMVIFELLRGQIWFCVFCVKMIVRARVSLNRLNEFLNKTELLDKFTQDASGLESAVVMDEPDSSLIGFRDASFAWSKEAPTEEDGMLTPSSRRFILKIEGELFFKPRSINLVVGPTGSGKTSLLMALLGEMHAVHAGPGAWFNLPRAQGVAFAAQESWVLNETIKKNILFNSPYDAARYNQVIHQCCLERDLELFDAGDETEVGEKGITLSGGQKARVTLARAIYSTSQIFILDDILAALDVHTARWIVDKCLCGPLVAGRTVILVTHNISLTQKIANFVVSVGLDGRVRGESSVAAALAHDQVLAQEVTREQEVIAKDDEKIDADVADSAPKADAGRLIVEEEVEIGRVSMEAMGLFFKAHSSRPYLFFVGLLFNSVITHVLDKGETYFLGYWASQYGQGHEVSTLFYVGIFSGIASLTLIADCVAYAYYSLGSFYASKTIHTLLMDSVFGSTFRWLDVTPSSRIVQRFTGDIGAVDDDLAEAFWNLIGNTLYLITSLFAVVLFTPLFTIPGIAIGLVGIYLGRIYMASQLSVKREMSNAKAPVLAHVNATVGGLASLRAYGAEEAFVQISMARINRFMRAQRTFANLNRWVTTRVDMIGALFVRLVALTALSATNPQQAMALAFYLVYFESYRPSNVGFSLTMAINFSRGIFHWVWQFNQFEIQSNSLERIKQYLEIEQEPKPTPSGVPPAYWPASGNISVDGLQARYSLNGPKVLQDISFEIQSGQRIGVIGRTGSGKSSLTLALLRCIFTEGNVLYDGIPTASINLDALRSNITIIPQSPELLAGSLRSNVDILGQLDDATLNNALRSAGLMALQEDMEEGSAKLTLDSEISAGGSNVSVGQRQIIALARAIVRGSKLLILDEATSAIDYKTDNVIQRSLRTELPKDTTVLTVAHRLQTIMDADKIMVLDAGRIVEFDAPKTLLNDQLGKLHALVEESGNKDELYAMAGL